jgi:hypothetical protein
MSLLGSSTDKNAVAISSWFTTLLSGVIDRTIVRPDRGCYNFTVVAWCEEPTECP